MGMGLAATAQNGKAHALGSQEAALQRPAAVPETAEEQLSHGTSAHSFGSVGNKNLFSSNTLRYPELPDSEATSQRCRNPSKLQPQEFGLKKCPTKVPGQK